MYRDNKDRVLGYLERCGQRVGHTVLLSRMSYAMNAYELHKVLDELIRDGLVTETKDETGHYYELR